MTDKTMETSPTTFAFGHWGTSSEATMTAEFPVHRACRDGDVQALDQLLAAGRHGVFDEDAFYGWTPAHWAAYFGRLDCLMRVIQYRCNNGKSGTSSTGFSFPNMSVDVATKRFGQTPSHVAAFAGNVHCLKWLLHCGAGLDRQDYLGETSLHKAARTGSMECAQMLTSHAADPRIRNKNGQSPKDLARACGYLKIAAFLDDMEKATPEKPSRPLPNLGIAEEDSMETGDTVLMAPGLTPETSSNIKSSGSCPASPRGDVLSDGAVALNVVPVGGRKRHCADDRVEGAKRVRLDGAGDFVPDLSFLFGLGPNEAPSNIRPSGSMKLDTASVASSRSTQESGSCGSGTDDGVSDMDVSCVSVTPVRACVSSPTLRAKAPSYPVYY